MAQAEVLCMGLSTCLSVRCIGGSGGRRCRLQAAAGLAEAIERVRGVGVDAGVVVQKDGKRGWPAETGRGGVQGGVLARDHVLGQQVRGADWSVWSLRLSTAGTAGFSGQRGLARTWWVEGRGVG